MIFAKVIGRAQAASACNLIEIAMQRIVIWPNTEHSANQSIPVSLTYA